jgi:hypothetical protein
MDGTRGCTLRLSQLSGYTARLYRADEATKLGWYSPRFGHKVPCTTLVVEAKPPPDTIDEWGALWRIEVQA